MINFVLEELVIDSTVFEMFRKDYITTSLKLTLFLLILVIISLFATRGGYESAHELSLYSFQMLSVIVRKPKGN